MNNLKNLTVIIVTYRTSKRIIEDNIKSIDKNVRVLFTSNINRTVEYYTGMNFNLMVDIKKKKNTLLSGGRFDKLIGNLASKNIPAVGAALNSNIL